MKQRVDSYNFRLEIYLRFFPRKKFTNPFSMELFSNLEKIFSPKKKKKIQKVFLKTFLRKKLSPEKFSPKILSTHLKDFETQSSPLKKYLLPKKMINLLQETKKKVEEKNLLSRFPEFDRRSIFAAALYEKLAAEAATAGAVNQFVPAENILKSEANIGLLGREDECECLSELFFMRAHGIIHDACGRAYCEMGVGKGYCYAVENPTIFMKSSPFLGHISGIAFCIWNRKKLRKIFE